MFRKVVASVVAMAVLWHATAGCCAHHTHCHAGEPQSHVGGSQAPALCSHSHAPRSTCGAPVSLALGEASLTVSSPCHEHAGCDEGKCAFTASQSVKLLDIYDVSGPAEFLAAIASQEATLVAASHRLRVPLPEGGLRRHLAVGVMLI